MAMSTIIIIIIIILISFQLQHINICGLNPVVIYENTAWSTTLLLLHICINAVYTIYVLATTQKPHTHTPNHTKLGYTSRTSITMNYKCYMNERDPKWKEILITTGKHTKRMCKTLHQHLINNIQTTPPALIKEPEKCLNKFMGEVPKTKP